MKAKRYEVIASSSGLEYLFTSEGNKGTINKIVQYTCIEADIFNLAFGDVNEAGEIADDVVSNNGDITTVMATVIGTIEYFSELHPDAKVIFKGVDDKRQHLYHTIITRHYNELSKTFTIYGLKEFIDPATQSTVLLPLPFDTGQNYNAFLIVKK